MGQTKLQLVCGFFWLTLDSILQRFINWGVTRRCSFFRRRSNLLAGKTAVITGANTGLGFETARWLSINGAKVILACRSRDKAEAAANVLRRDTKQDSMVSVVELDLSNLDSVRSCAEHLAGTEDKIDILILNAGVMGVYDKNTCKSEPHMAINHVAHSLFLLRLAPTLRRNNGRVVSVSSYASIAATDWKESFKGERKSGVWWFRSYANSKLAQLLFARALDKRTKDLPILCVHPGESTTEVSRNLAPIFRWIHHNLVGLLLLSPREAARTSVYAAVIENKQALEKARGGTLLHAVHRSIVLPSRLLNDDEAEWMWSKTLACIDITEKEANDLLGK